MTKEDLAAKLDGMPHDPTFPAELLQQAKVDRLVIVYGASDDLIEFRGALLDEELVYGGGDVLIDGRGVLPPRAQLDGASDGVLRQYLARKEVARTITALWDPGEGLSWAYLTDIPNATFTLWEGSERYCRGLVISLDDLPVIPLFGAGLTHRAAQVADQAEPARSTPAANHDDALLAVGLVVATADHRAPDCSSDTSSDTTSTSSSDSGSSSCPSD